MLKFMKLLGNFLCLAFAMAVYTELGRANPPIRLKLETHRYEPYIETLTGILDTRIYPGPPNYESVKEGDRPNKVWLIKLPKPISMDVATDSESFNEKETGIEELQIILTNLKDGNTLKRHKGETVTLIGVIFHSHTIHHHLPLLMEVQSYKLHAIKRTN